MSPAVAGGIEFPRWELGAAVGAGILPHYPAADQYRMELLPLPYFAYRGKFVRSDDKGLLRGRVFLSDRAELDISLAGSIALDATDNRVRVGMPDLDWIGEVGPRLQLTLARISPDAKVDLEIPVRAVFSTDFHWFDHVGYVSIP